MKRVNVTELRAHLPEYLGRARRGESIVVMSRGKPVARLMPVGETAKSAREQIELLRKRARIGDVVSPIDTQWNVARDSA